MKVYLALDPLDEGTLRPRVAMRDQPFDPAQATPSHELAGEPWQHCEGELEEETWSALLRGELTPDEQDNLHRDLWNRFGPTPFPETP